jgi:thiol-disulfide isomerase/thioredoxin/Tfp pilus assembly protein PilF
MRTSLSILVLVASFLAPSFCFANESMGTPAARAEFEKGETARWASNFRSAAEAYHRAIEIDPDFAKAHENYIFVSQLVTPNLPEKDAKTESSDGFKTEEERERQAGVKARARLQIEYEELARQHPDRAVYQWGLGWINLESQPQAAERYFRNALRIDLAFAPAFSALSIIDEARGDLASSREDLRKAVEANPGNPEYLFRYADELRDVNPQEGVRLLTHLLQKFPESESASSALFVLADQAGTSEEKIRYLEMLKAKFPPSKSELSEGGMMMLFNLYARSDSGKALALAKEMKGAKPNEKGWALSVSYEEQMISAERLLARGNAKGALDLLSEVHLPFFADHAQLDMLRARAAETSGDVAKGYGDLLKIFASEPTDDLQAAITSYGQKLGKTPNQINAEALRIRDANAKPANPFTLPGYGAEKHVSLSDFKGRVVLLNFWYPECGPCREEFPRLRAIFEKYKNQGFAVIAINIEPAQDDFVLSLLRGYKLDFIPAQDDKKVSMAYDVQGVPANFLIGADGRIWFHPKRPISDLSKQRTLELQVESLLHLKDDKPNDEK